MHGLLTGLTELYITAVSTGRNWQLHTTYLLMWQELEICFKSMLPHTLGITFSWTNDRGDLQRLLRMTLYWAQRPCFPGCWFTGSQFAGRDALLPGYLELSLSDHFVPKGQPKIISKRKRAACCWEELNKLLFANNACSHSTAKQTKSQENWLGRGRPAHASVQAVICGVPSLVWIVFVSVISCCFCYRQHKSICR